MASLLSRQTKGPFCRPPTPVEASEVTVIEISPHCEGVVAFQRLLSGQGSFIRSGTTRGGNGPATDGSGPATVRSGPATVRSGPATQNLFFLDSALRRHSLSRYSFLGYRPFLVLKSKGDVITVEDSNGVREMEGNPFEALRFYLQAFRVTGAHPPKEDVSLPPDLLGVCRTGMAVGYLGYDLRHFLERLPRNTVDDLGFPEMYFGFYDRFVVYDHKEGRCFLVGRDLEDDIREATSLLSVHSMVSEGKKGLRVRGKGCQIKGNFTKKGYLEAVRRAKEYIARGDIYQVNLSQRFQTGLDGAPHELYLRLRDINPAPFSAYLQFDDNVVISSSPERFLRVQSGRVQTRPIKGTRPRGKDPSSDQRLMTELLHSPKDDAELTMIVDLERNDLGKVCNYGSVKVVEKKELEAHPTVFHLVATVEGDLYPQYDLVDLLKATFPGGSVTGAPKIRAMEIIDELEPTSRGVYTGAIGYIGFDGSMDLAIAIRTFLIRGPSVRTPGTSEASTVFFQVGGGIVADSQPEEEYQETLFKSRALMESLNGVQ